MELETRIFKNGTGRFCRTVWPVEEDLLWKWSVLDRRAKQLLSTKASNSIYFPTEIFGNSACWKAYLRQPIECILPHPILHFSWEELPSKQKLHKFGEKRKFWKRALVISLRRGSDHFSDRFFSFSISSILLFVPFSICFVFVLLLVILSRLVVGFRPK